MLGGRNSEMSSRRFSTRELLGYVTVVAVLGSIWCLEDPGPLLAIPAIFLTGAMLAGPVGLVIGGRKWFIPAALVGSIVFFVLLLIPAMYAVR